jgi:hypothetical protein
MPDLEVQVKRMSSELNFVRQQGLRDASPASCAWQYPALMFQPRAIGILVLVGLVLQAWPWFLGLGVLLWWNVLLPDLNPFDALHARLVGNAKGSPWVNTAPSPRRFGAQPIAGTFMLAIALCLYLGWNLVAWSLEAFLVAALAALIFGRFCLGSYVYLLLTGQGAFARATLPWARGGNGAKVRRERGSPAG